MPLKIVHVVLAMAAFAGAPRTVRQTPAQVPTFRAHADLVTVNVVVRSATGQPVTGLTEQDFDVIDSGQQAAIAEFRAGAAPATVAVLFDVSGSMRLAGKVDAARDAVRQVLHDLQPGTDEVALFTFDMNLEQLQPFTRDPGEVESRLDAIVPFGSTALYDATAATARAVLAHDAPRGVIVVVTDGGDTSSEMSAVSAGAVARTLDVPVYVFEIVPPLERPSHPDTVVRGPDLGPSDALKRLGDMTGGAAYVVSTPADRTTVAQQIVTDVRSQYVLAFAAGSRPGWHPLEVHVKKKDVVVRARAGYTAGAGVKQAS